MCGSGAGKHMQTPHRHHCHVVRPQAEGGGAFLSNPIHQTMQTLCLRNRCEVRVMGCKRLQCVYNAGEHFVVIYGGFVGEKSFEFPSSFKSQVLNVCILQQMVVARIWVQCAICMSRKLNKF